MNKTSLPIPVTVKKIIKENFKTKSFVLDSKIKALPGQFIMVWLPEIAEKPFSITNISPFTITIMTAGKFTKHMNEKVKKGDTIWFRGPFGKGIFKQVKGRKILVSGGCGCVPLYFFAKTLKNKKSVQVIVGAKTKKELLFVKKFKDLGLNVQTTTDDGTAGKKGYTTEELKRVLNTEKINCVYACGPEVMLSKIAHICKEKNVKYQISLEALMKCGFGVCGSCSIGGKLVCKDGPVFTKWPGKL